MDGIRIMSIHRPELGFRNIRRYREIASVFIKYGFGEIVYRLSANAAIRIGLKVIRATPPPQATYATRIRMALEELGPTFVKLGQVLSMRPFLIPIDLVVELTKLQDQVSPMPPETAIRIIEENLGCKISEKFSEFDSNPIASASLSQVHNARLKDGTAVVIKVQRAGIKKIIEADMVILRDIAALLEKHIPESRQYDPSGMISELAKSTKKEINFLLEARNIEIFARNFSDDDRVVVPRVHWDFTTRHMITMDRIDGIKINDLARMREMRIDSQEICRVGGDMVFKMVFEHGFFHADPHPGNLFVTNDGRIAPLDFGMMGFLSDTQLIEIGEMLAAVVSNNAKMLVYTFSKLGVIPESTNNLLLESELNEMLSRYHRTPLARIDMSTISEEFFDIVHKHGLKVRSEFMVFGKALVTYEEVARQLDPDYDFIKSAAPYVKRLALKKFEFKRLAGDMQMAISELREFLLNFPREARLFTSKLNKGQVRLGLDILGLDRFIMELDRASNRLAYAIVIAAIIVGSSFIMTVDVGFRVYGVPILGLLGYLFAGILGAILAISILRSGKL
jgi:ubiquinone biosynthesis protein